MAAYTMRTAQVRTGQVPSVTAFVCKAASTFPTGAMVVVDSDGYVDECGVDPALIAGVALQAAFSGPGNDMANSPTTITGQNTYASVAIANPTTVFQAELTNASSTRIAPTQTDIGGIYGVTAYSNVWTVDKGKTGGSARVNVIGFFLPPNGTSVTGVVLFTVIPANCQF